jgi:hypothetical protein
MLFNSWISPFPSPWFNWEMRWPILAHENGILLWLPELGFRFWIYGNREV